MIVRISKIIILIYIIPFILINGWGDKGHKLVTKHAMMLLPNELRLSDKMKDEIITHSKDPDYRKKEDPTEANKHYIDIDFYKEFLDGRMIYSKDSLIKIYGIDEVEKQGILPWATQATYSKLVDAFKSDEKEKIILYASDLAHYVGDGHQPQHATLNYNGEITNQKGIHFRYEIEMIDRYLPELENMLEKREPRYVKNLKQHIFDYITESNYYCDLILSADKFSYEHSGKEFNENYYRLLWNRTKYVTATVINEGAFELASLIYSAWIDAGKPELNI